MAGPTRPRHIASFLGAALGGSTARWLAGRLTTSLAAVFVVMSAVFLVTRLIANPAQRMLPVGSSQDRIDALNAKLGLSEPLLVQYGIFLRDMLTLNLGESIWYHQPALQVALSACPRPSSCLAILS